MITKNKQSQIFYFILSCCLVIAISSCEEERIELGPAPSNPTFTLEMVDANTVRVTNTTTGVIPYWDFGNGATGEGQSAEVAYPFMGDYIITLTVFGQGGRASSTQTVSILEDDPDICQGDAFIFLTGCSSKSWQLIPEEGALWVGPDAANDPGNVWWQSSAADVTGRACTFDDTYTFNTSGDFIYDGTGEVWVESFWEGISSDMCLAEGELPAATAAWGSGNHAFVVQEGSPAKLTVNGNGAFIALPKAANGAEVSVPQSSITYDILSMESDGNRDILTISVNFGGQGNGDWRFKLVSN